MFHYSTQSLIHPLISGNPLSCNCRLSWIYTLRNETKDSTLKHALEKISCVEDATVDRNPNVQETEDIDNANVLSDDSYDYYDKNDEYNEVKPRTTAKKLIDIPLETLPCPKEIMQSIEESYGHPVQNEIRLKAFSAVGRIVPNSILTAILAKMMF